ncbi:MAG: hypothetical protein RDV48_03265 [Candidatus Eremiobacteraeota bacterium]|nr:hypothetical protein [Candidatus Eremiobacteraeota bacterium]
MDEDALMKEKLDPDLYRKLKDDCAEPVQVIVQTQDGLKEDDRKIMKTLGGKIKDDLYIINAFSAELPCMALKSLILSPRVVRVYFDAQVRAI